MIGYRLAEDSVKNPDEAEFDAKQAEKLEKLEEKRDKQAENFDKKIKKVEYQRKIHQMNMDTLLQIQERKEYIKELKKNSKTCRWSYRID